MIWRDNQDHTPRPARNDRCGQRATRPERLGNNIATARDVKTRIGPSGCGCGGQTPMLRARRLARQSRLTSRSRALASPPKCLSARRKRRLSPWPLPRTDTRPMLSCAWTSPAWSSPRHQSGHQNQCQNKGDASKCVPKFSGRRLRLWDGTVIRLGPCERRQGKGGDAGGGKKLHFMYPVLAGGKYRATRGLGVRGWAAAKTHRAQRCGRTNPARLHQ
jgi:hypothetical protein